MQQQGQLLDADDLFSDLIGSSVLPKSSAKPAAQQLQPGSSGPPSNTQPARISSSGHAGPKEPVLPEPDLLDSALAKPSSNGAGQQQGAGVNREELKEVVSEVVQDVVDASLSKFVRSLRTVLEDMGRRIDATGHAANSLKESVEQLREDYESQAGNMHARFTAVDLAVKEVERGVQSLRDKQELMEAQAMLAKLSTPTEQPHSSRGGGPSSTDPGRAEAATTPTAVAAAAAAAAAAPAPAASAPPAAAAPAAPPAAAVMAPPSLPQQIAPAVAAPVAPPPGTTYAPQAPPAAAGVPCAPPMAPAPPPPQQPQQQQPQYGPPPPAPYGAPPPGPPPPAPPAFQQPPPQMQAQQPPSSSYMQMPPGPPPPQMQQQQQPMAPPPGAGPPPPPGYGPGPVPHHMGPPPPGAGPPGPNIYGPPPGHMQGPAGPQYPSAPTGAYPPPFRTGSGPAPHPGPGRSGGGGGPGPMPPGPPTLDRIVNDIVAMGFSHGQVMGVVRQLQSSGQGLEMNVIIDKLMAQSR